jgi:uncharacterized protein with HEPN domain
MLPLEVRKYLFDMDQAADLIAEFVAGRGFGDYAANPMLRSAVERQFEIVGEALNQALRRAPELGSLITDSSRIIAFRNRLVHGYASVSCETVWGIIEGNLPVLREQLKRLLRDEGHVAT